ncbi:MAG: PAS domain S-box protein, partial [Acidobacteria bacterium]|nr:PAS domain S-box protein [Acidobacteriota bacterium]
MRKLIENAPIMISVLRVSDFVYELVNPAFQALAPGKQMLGRRLTEVWPETDLRESLLPYLEEVISTGRTFQTVDARFEIQRYPGAALEEIFVTLSSIPLYGPDGKPDRILTVANETTAAVRQREQLQRALKQNEAIIANMSEGLLIADPEGNVLSMNPAGLRLHGLDDSSARRNLRDFPELSVNELNGALVPAGNYPLARVLRGETISEWELRITNTRKNCAWIGSFSGTPIRDETGNIMLALLTFRDITQTKKVEQELRLEISERKRTERELRESEQRLARTQDIALVMALHMSLDGRWLKLPPTFVRFLGYGSAEEILGRPFKESTHPDDFQADWDQCQCLLRGEIQSFEMEKRFIRKDGSITWGYLNCSIVTDERGMPVHFLTYVRDINAEKRAEEALRRSEEAFRQLADSIPHAVWVMSPDRVPEYLNRRYFDYTGLTPEEAYGDLQSKRRLIHPDDVARFDAGWSDFLRTGNEMSIECRLKGPQGDYRWKLGRAVAARDREGRITRYFGTITDIHDRKTAEEAMRQAQKLESIGVLAGGVAHDFNNLLASIIGNASVLREQVPEEAAAQVDAILNAGERAADLTRQLLAYAGKGRFVIKPVDVSETVREMTELLQSSIPQKVRLHKALEPNLPPVEADPGQIQQIVMNMVLNAAEAIPEDQSGVVLIRTDLKEVSDSPVVIDDATGAPLAPGQYVCFEVRDSGQGMDEQTKAKIFDPFFTTKFMGRGLGLPAVAGIVKAHRGAIKVMSTPGTGTTFQVYLPAGGKGPRGGHSPGTSAGHAGLSGSETVLVVDDEQMLRDFTRLALQKSGYKVLTAENGRDALRVFEENIEAVVL